VASGQPFTDREKAFIREHAGTMLNGMIAQKLATLYPEDNNGYRSYRSIRSFIYREKYEQDTRIVVSVPRQVIREAKESGKSIEEIAMIARRAICEALT